MNGHEWLALRYLRLNGYFTLPNFMAHRRGGALTEVDVLGVRFPYRKNLKMIQTSRSRKVGPTSYLRRRRARGSKSLTARGVRRSMVPSTMFCRAARQHSQGR